VRIVYRGLAAALAGLCLLPAVSRAAQPVAGHFRLALDTAAASADYSQTPARDDYVVLQGYQSALARRLKAQNPSLKVLVYKDLSAMVDRDPYSGLSSTGVTTNDAAAHPDWYLLNTSGRRFTFRYYDWMWGADVGNAGYQQKWADNVLSEVRANGWDGVFMDDVNPSLSYHYDVASVAEYPSDAAYQAATGSALSAIGARFRAEGKLVIGNFGFWKDYPSVISRWLGYVDGGQDEMFVKVGDNGSASNYVTGSIWETQLQEVKDAAAQGKVFLGVSHSSAGDAAAARYGWATMLLGAAGNARFSFTSDYTNETWFPEYDYAIGAPSGAESRGSNGVHRRAFGNGLVLVNPTTASAAVSFGGTYTGSGLTNATAATMAPHSALVLVKAGGDAPFQDGATGTDGPPAPAPGEGQPVSPSPSPSGGTPASPGPSGGTPAPSRTQRVAVTVRCRLARTCRGRVKLKAAGATVAQRTVRLRARRTTTLHLAVPALATAASTRAPRLTVSAPHGVTAPRSVKLAG
jgi:Hypothetical glycosyl hydrolase family 15